MKILYRRTGRTIILGLVLSCLTGALGLFAWQRGLRYENRYQRLRSFNHLV